MQVKVVMPEVKLDDKLCVAFDVGKAYLDSYSPFSNGPLQMVMNDRVPNKSNAVRGALMDYQKLAAENGLEGVHVVCEPTGGYERTLLRIAHEMGMTTGYVNGESVSKIRVVRQNDTGKTDQLDPPIILLSSTQRQLKVRCLESGYAELRELNVYYDQICDQASVWRNHVHDALYRIFPDLEISNAVLFGACGDALVKAVGGDPVSIAHLSLDVFMERMKRHAPRLRSATMKRIHSDARINSMHVVPTPVRAIQRDHLREVYEQWQRLESRKTALKEQMASIYKTLPEAAKLEFPNVSDFMMARIIGETGPLSDYASCRRLLRMAGLNIRQKTSGKYKGKNKISKKGRARLRKILYQAVMLFMIKPGGIYCMEYARKRVDGCTSLPVIVALMSRFTRAIFGLYRSETSFDIKRLTTCESQMKAA